MCQTKTVLVSLPFTLLVVASFSIQQAHTKNKMGHHSEIICQGSWENEYKKYCLNGGEY